MKLEEFLNTSLTAFHAVENCEKILKENQFERLHLTDKFDLKKGGKYYITKNQSSLIAFVIGEGNDYFFNIAASHTDSPSLRVKGEKLIDTPEGKRINVERYGSLINYSIFDIPLKVAGRIFVEDNGEVVSKLVQSQSFVNIPSLAIHQNRNVNENNTFSVQNDMLPLIGDAESVYSLFNENNVIDSDLFVVPAISPFYSGYRDQYLCSPRIDNLVSVYSSINAICDCESKGISIVCCFDNEEIGSRTKQGANSSFLTTVLQAINNALSLSQSDFYKACEKGLILSIDNAHATHPAHPEKSDIKNKVNLGGGVVFKHHTNYSTDGYSSALLKLMLKNKKNKYQDFYCNSDYKGSSTLGLFLSAQLSMNACDIGIPQLAMHSCVETIYQQDVESLIKCCKSFFETYFDCKN